MGKRLDSLVIGMSLLLIGGHAQAEQPAVPAEEMTHAQSTTSTVPAPVAPPVYLQPEDTEEKAEAITITVQGYGSPPKRYYPDGQRKLMAMRAAKLDAYRALAERIHGLRIYGGTTIGDMVVEKDRFRVLLDAFVLGAKVISLGPAEDGNYEAVVEAVVDERFLAQVFANRSRELILSMEPVYVQRLQPQAPPPEPYDPKILYDYDARPNFYYSGSN